MKFELPLPRTPRSHEVLVVGENSGDLMLTVDGHPAPNSKRELLEADELPGGEGATAAVGLARLGCRARYVGRFGDDRVGSAVRQALAAEGVNVDGAVVVPGVPNRSAVVLVDRQSGGRTVLWRRAPDLALQPDDIPDDLIADSRVVVVGSDDVETMASVARRARAAGVRTVGDMERIHGGTDRLLRELDVIVMAATFPSAFTGRSEPGAALRAIAAATGAYLTCVTLGEEGCLARVGEAEVRVPAFRVKAVDTTGAGDLFRAGLIAAWLQHPEGQEVSELLRYAAAVAALGCRARGAWAGAPTPTEVAELLRT